jgi:hypothetical protein
MISRDNDWYAIAEQLCPTIAGDAENRSVNCSSEMNIKSSPKSKLWYLIRKERLSITRTKEIRWNSSVVCIQETMMYKAATSISPSCSTRTQSTFT